MSNHSNKPKTFGERFKEEVISGILKSKKKYSKGKPDEMHFLDHLDAQRLVIFKAVLASLYGRVCVAFFMHVSVRLL